MKRLEGGDEFKAFSFRLAADNSLAGDCHLSDHTAGNFGAGTAGWLSRKIIGMIVDDDCSADHLIDGKAIGQKYAQRESVVSKQRGQVSGVVRVSAAVGVVMGHGVGKGIVHISAAVGPLVDMKSEDPFMARQAVLGKAADLGADDHAIVGLVKAHSARQVRAAFAACDGGRRLCPAAQNGEKTEPGVAAW